MILKFKYYKENNNLVAYQNYTLAQNSHVADKINIISTDEQAQMYNYCLEFVCYNTKNIPKSQYISTILEYSDNGIEYDIPNNLTQYRGHTDIQLTIYNKQNNNIISKSIAKNSKAFDVEGSLCVLENGISDTPNVITEIMNQLDYLNDIKSNLVQEFLTTANAEFSAIMSVYEWHTVRLWDRDILLDECCYVHGYKITKPKNIALPNGCELYGGWYDKTNNKIWDFDNDIITKNIDLVLNYYTTGLVMYENKVVDYTGNFNNVYIPYFYNNHRIEGTNDIAITSITPNIIVYYNDYVRDCNMASSSLNITQVKIPKSNTYLQKTNAFIFDAITQKLHYVDKLNKDEIIIPANITSCSNNIMYGHSVKSLTFGSDITQLVSDTVSNCPQLTSIVLPTNLKDISNLAVVDCPQLESVYCLCPIPPKASSNSIVSSPKNSHQTTRPTIYTLAESVDLYKQSIGWDCYEIQPIGGVSYDELVHTAQEQSKTYTDQKSIQILSDAKQYLDEQLDEQAIIIQNIRGISGGNNV